MGGKFLLSRRSMAVVCLDETVSVNVRIETSIHSVSFTTLIYLESYVQLRGTSFVHFDELVCRL
jgi:hypothetical protein